MVRGITFDKQALASEDFAHQVNYFYQGKMGVTKGCEVNIDVDGNLVVTEGYFTIYGRLLKNEGETIVEVPTVPAGTLFSCLVFEVDLTKENTIDAFNQGQFKIVSNAVTYPTLVQENLDNGGNIYQLEFAKFENTVAGIINLQDTRTILSMQMYTPQDEFNTHLAESATKTSTMTTSLSPAINVVTKSGNVVTISLYVSQGFSGDISIANIPLEFRSSTTQYAAASFTTSGVTVNYYALIGVDGNVTIPYTSSTISSVYVSGTYIV